MTTQHFRRTALVSLTTFSLLALPLQAHAAFDYRSIPLIGGLLGMMMPAAKPAAQVAPPVIVYPANRVTTPMWSVPQPAAGYTYVNGQAQRVYNVYTPQTQVQTYSMPANYPSLQQSNPQAAQQMQQQLGVVTPAQTAQWQYQVSPVAYQQTVPNAPQMGGINMASSSSNASGNTGPSGYGGAVGGSSGYSTPSYNSTSNGSAASSTNVPTSLNDNRVVDTNQSGTYKWPVATNSSGTTGYVSSVYGPRDRDNFVKGCSDGTAPASHCGVKMHSGIDLNVPHGTKVESMTSGKVVHVDPYCSNPAAKLAQNKDPTSVTPRGGCTVSVLNSSGEMVTYQHLSDPGELKVGDAINAGDPIGKSGNSGGSFGAHLDIAVCNISEEKVAAAQKAKSNLSRCEANGGKTINPLDKLDPKDPRAASARAKEKINATYLACKKAAGKDFAAVQKCRATFKAKYNAPPAPVKIKPIESMTGKLNMGRG